MSSINGDKARHNRQQKKKAHLRAKLRTMLPKKPAQSATTSAAPAATAAAPAPVRKTAAVPPKPARPAQG